MNEFERISSYFAPLTQEMPGAFGLLDDAARLSVPEGEELIVTTDTIVETVHFFGNEDPYKIALKLLRVSLSDLIAKGSKPFAYTLNLALPQSIADTWIERFVAGLEADQKHYQVSLIGGDTVRSTAGLVLTATLFGTAPIGRSLTRLGAKLGDEIYVSGVIGDASLGLRVIQGEFPFLTEENRSRLIDAYEIPEPPLKLLSSLREFATASMDVSDGLVADLEHLCSASKVSACIELGDVPLSSTARMLVDQDPTRLVECIGGGDDYQTLCTIPFGKGRDFINSAQSKGLAVTKIGVITARGQKLVSVKDASGKHVAISTKGYIHG